MICGGNDTVLLAQIMATTFAMCGLSTFIMATFGVRLVSTRARFTIDILAK